MVDKTTLKVVELLARLGGTAVANPLNVFAEVGRIAGDAVERQRRALDLFQTDAGPALRPGNEAWLLHASHSPVPFGFRDAEMADFKEWFYDTDGDTFLKCRLLTGGSGRGKTRFVRELIRSLKADGGVTGAFLDPVAVSDRPDDIAGFLDIRGDVIVVVDYAERFREVVALLLLTAIAMEQALSPGLERRTRVILISRASTELWANLGTDYPLIGMFRSRLAGGWEDRPLAPLAEAIVDRNAAFVTAYRAFDGHFVEHWPDVESRPVPDPLPDLSDESFKDALLIHLAALALWHEGAQVGDVSRDRLLDWLLGRERRAWNQQLADRGLSRDLQGPPIEQAATLLTYVSVGGEGIGGRARAIELLRACPLLKGCPAPTLSAIADVFRDLYPGPAWVNGMTPDMIGQYLLRVTDDEFLDEFDGDIDEA